jgi:redox-sensitive bicupin YhaK (pirin superfamily)
VSVRFVLRAAERGFSRLVSTGANASYVAGHPDGVITRHSSFNFHDYQSGIPGFGCIRVFGDEVFAPNGTGYNMHPHHNFIIMAFVLAGTLTHINTLGKPDTLGAGDYYVFSTGSGGKHSELNIERADANILYLWILPSRLLAPPSYRRRRFDAEANADRIACLIGDAPDALPIDQALKVSRLVSTGGKRHVYRAAPGHGVYAFVVDGEASIGGTALARRDSVGFEGEEAIEIAVETDRTDLLLIETTF